MVLNLDLKKNDVLKLNNIKFIRTKNLSDMSQLDIIKSFGKKISKDLAKGTVLVKKHFIS